MQTVNVEKAEGKAFKNNSGLITEIVELVKPSYVDYLSLLDREINHCNSIYLLRDSSQKLITFCLVSWEDLIVNGKETPSLYLGLCVTSQETKGTGMFNNLYKRVIADAQRWEKNHLQKLVVWYTTPSPSIIYAMSLLFDASEPNNEGEYTPENEKYALAIREKLHQGFNVNPFILKNYATGTRYSSAERKHIDKIIQEKNFKLFLEMGIKEEEGDRLIRICRVPKVNSYNAITA
jgi:hypothetical protein